MKRLLVLCLAVLAWSEASAAPCMPQRIAFSDLFRKGEWQRLDDSISEFRQNVDSGACSDGTLYESMLFAGNGDPALTALHDAWVAAMPNSAYALATRGRHFRQYAEHYRSHTPSAAQRARRIDNNQRAERDLLLALTIDPNFTITHTWLIEAAHTPEEAEKRATAGLAVAPHSYAIRWAHLFRQAPKWGGSLSAVERTAQLAREHEPKDARLRAFRGMVDYVYGDQHAENEEFNEALARADSALEKGDLNYARRLRAIALVELQRLEEAEKELVILEGRQFWPGWTLEMRAIIARERRDYVSATTYFRQSLDADFDPDIAASLAPALDYQGQPQQGFEVLAQALKKFPDHAHLLEPYVKSLVWVKRYREAIAGAEALFAIDPENSMAWFWGGAAHEQLGDLTSALKWMERAVEISPHWSYGQYELGRFYERKLSNDPKALQHYRLAKKQDRNPSALMLLSLACTADRLGYQDEAKEALQAAWPGCQQGDCNQATAEQGAWAQLAIAGKAVSSCQAEIDRD